MIRGHDTPADGYDLHFGDRCITVASHTATPMVAMLDPGKRLYANSKDIKDVPATIRLVQLDLSTDPDGVHKWNRPSSD